MLIRISEEKTGEQRSIKPLSTILSPSMLFSERVRIQISQTKKGRTPLWYAIPDVSAMELLLSKADPNQVVNGQPILHFAVVRGYQEATELLLKNGADPHIKDENDNCVLHHAFRSSRNVLMINSLVVNWSREPNHQNKEGQGPLHVAAASLVPAQAVDCLLREGIADPELEDRDGEYPLGIAVRCGNLSCVKALVVTGRAKPTITDEVGNTLLHLSAQNSASPWTEATSSSQDSPYVDIARFLVEECKLDPRIGNKKGQTPSERAKMLGATAVAKYFDSVISSLEEPNPDRMDKYM
eukprot:gb/GECG01005278.1/.p1 GENE.gb/GECG01005278.1/~~gb/GECG01005278.1/.p1  ORF type:complete len:297 (+),score=30.50 gb/GECG01005278.1/:1-891(+)